MNSAYNSSISPSGRIHNFTILREDADLLHRCIQESEGSVVHGLRLFVDEMFRLGKDVTGEGVSWFLHDWGALAERLRDKTWDELRAETSPRVNFRIYEDEPPAGKAIAHQTIP